MSTYSVYNEPQFYIGGTMPVTSVHVDEEVLRAAKLAFGVRTNREAIDLALRDAVMRQKQLEAIAFVAGMDFSDPEPR